MNIRIIAAAMIMGLAALGGGCASQPESVQTVKEFRARVAAKNYSGAQELLSPNARRWFDEKQGEGMPWSVGSGSTGPWAAWDTYFNKRTEVVRWETGENEVSVVYREINNYFRLLDRGWVTNRNTYYLNDQGELVGLLVAPADDGERPQGRTDEFVAWLKSNDPRAYEELMPNGHIDPSGNHPQEMRKMLNRWRNETGLPPILMR